MASEGSWTVYRQLVWMDRVEVNSFYNNAEIAHLVYEGATEWRWRGSVIEIPVEIFSFEPYPLIIEIRPSFTIDFDIDEVVDMHVSLYSCSESCSDSEISWLSHSEPAGDLLSEADSEYEIQRLRDVMAISFREADSEAASEYEEF